MALQRRMHLPFSKRINKKKAHLNKGAHMMQRAMYIVFGPEWCCISFTSSCTFVPPTLVIFQRYIPHNFPVFQFVFYIFSG